MADALDERAFRRYARHLILDEVGEDGQTKLLESRVLIVGAGGLGSPVALYLAAAGVGHLTLVDDDVVDDTNLQRQIIHSDSAIGRAKVESAAETLARLDPHIKVDAKKLRVDEANIDGLIAGHDLVIDGSDNFDTRYAVHDACYRARVTLVSASLLRFEAQISTYKAYDGKTACLRCLHPEKPPPDLIPRCEEAGILGAVAGVAGSLQASEALKELLGLGKSLAGNVLIYDALDTNFRRIAVPKDPHCKLCGTSP